MPTKKLLAILAAGLVAGANTEAALVSVSLSTQVVSVGSTFTVDFRASGLNAGGAPSLGVFDFDFGFDPSRIAFQSAAFGTGLDVLSLGSLQVASPGNGTVNLFELSFDSVADLNDLQPDAFLLASITFLARAVGNAPFTLAANVFGDAEGSALDMTFGDAGSVTVRTDQNGVPEPASYALALLGLLGALLVSPLRPR